VNLISAVLSPSLNSSDTDTVTKGGVIIICLSDSVTYFPSSIILLLAVLSPSLNSSDIDTETKGEDIIIFLLKSVLNIGIIFFHEVCHSAIIELYSILKLHNVAEA
jgi:uncharacterized protein YuzE